MSDDLTVRKIATVIHTTSPEYAAMFEPSEYVRITAKPEPDQEDA